MRHDEGIMRPVSPTTTTTTTIIKYDIMNSQKRTSSDPCHRDGNRIERKGGKEGRMEGRKGKKRTELEIKKYGRRTNERTKRREGDKRWKERTLILESSDLRDPFAFTRRKRVADGWSGKRAERKKRLERSVRLRMVEKEGQILERKTGDDGSGTSGQEKVLSRKIMSVLSQVEKRNVDGRE